MSCCASAASNPSLNSTSAYDTTAITLTKNRPSADSRPASPTNSRAGNRSSPVVPATAATSGGNTGVWYSEWNRKSVVCQLPILISPDLKKSQPTQSRTASKKTESRLPNTRVGMPTRTFVTFSSDILLPSSVEFVQSSPKEEVRNPASASNCASSRSAAPASKPRAAAQPASSASASGSPSARLCANAKVPASSASSRSPDPCRATSTRSPPPAKSIVATSSACFSCQ